MVKQWQSDDRGKLCVPAFATFVFIMNDLNLCLIQTQLHWQDRTANLHHFESLIRHVHSADLIILPEMFTTGFSMEPEQLWDDPEGSTLEWMREMAGVSGAAITGSCIIKDQGHYYNRLYFVKPDGSFQTYDKRHLFTLAGEEKVYSPGRVRLVVEYKGWRILPLICYDLRFPVWCRNTVDADLMIFVANWPERRSMPWRSLLQARAIENMCYVAGLNRVGDDGNGVFHSGDSMVLDELGQHKLMLTPGEHDVQSVSINREKMLESRDRFSFLRDRDSFQMSID